MATIPNVSVRGALASEQPMLEQLLQLYLHDFSELAPLGSPFGEVEEDGRFGYPRLQSYWQEPGRVPLIIMAADRIAGFVLLNRWSALDRPLDWSVAEFFVLRKYRRAGVGSHAAATVFRRYSGRWEVPVADYNPAALSFWRTAVPPGFEEHAGDGTRWSGPVLTFTILSGLPSKGRDVADAGARQVDGTAGEQP